MGADLQSRRQTGLGWAGMAGLGWAGLGWAGLARVTTKKTKLLDGGSEGVSRDTSGSRLVFVPTSVDVSLTHASNVTQGILHIHQQTKHSDIYHLICYI